MIDLTELCHGLYIMEVPTYVLNHHNYASICNVPYTNVHCNFTYKCLNDIHLWHKRLGHFSLERHHNMSTQFPFISYQSNKFSYDVCQIFLHMKLPHFSTINKSSHIF